MDNAKTITENPGLPNVIKYFPESCLLYWQIILPFYLYADPLLLSALLQGSIYALIKIGKKFSAFPYVIETLVKLWEN